ncbi:MAG: hypothetical protein KJZ86_04480 [Caldilineaceae bacterium]|nr:hypothetical protein [Caldilineaceae bacterium]
MRKFVDRVPGPLWPALGVGLLAALLVAPLWGATGLPNSADGPLHLHRVAAMARAFEAGLFWPRWFPELYGGLGAPTFHYYSPLFYWLAALLHYGGLALDVSVKLLLTALFLLSALAAWDWLRRLFGALPALAGAALLLAQPHIFREFYFQGDYPQLVAVFLLPICLWSFTAFAQRRQRRFWLLAPLSLALLVLAHNLTAMIGAAFLALYWLLLAFYRRDWRTFLWGGVPAFTALLLSGFFWMAALGDVGLVQVQNLQRDFFSYRQYFLSWQELLSPILAFDQRAANPPFPHALGWPAWLALVGGGLAALLAGRGSPPVPRAGDSAAWPETPLPARGVRFWAGSGLALGVGFLLLTLPLSAPLWEGLPGLDLLQFPSRLLSLAALGCALAGAAALAALPVRWHSWALALAIGVILLCNAVFLFPRHPFLRFSAISPAETRQAEVANHLWGMTSGNEFLPRWADVTLSTAPPQSRKAGTVSLVWQTPHRATIQPGPGAGGMAVLPLHFFPAWQVKAGDKRLGTEADSQGRLAVEGVEGGQKLTLFWAGTEWQRRGERLSLLGLLLWLGLPFVPGLRGIGRGQPRAQPTPEGERRVWQALVLLLSASWLVWLGIVGSGVGWFQPYSPPGKAHRVEHPLSLTLGEEGKGHFQLLGWDSLSEGTIRPGDLLRVRLYWQPLEDSSEALHSFLHLYSPERKHSWAIVQNQNPGRIPTTGWLPSLYYVDELTLRVPADQPPGSFALAAGLVTEGGARLAVAGGSDGLVELGRVEISPALAGRLQPLRPSVPAPARVGEHLQLQGYDLLPAAGGPILRTFWESGGPLASGLTLFVHLLSPSGERLAQWDGPPLEGITPTEGWRAGALYIDRRQLWLPDGLSAGQYTIHVGLYDPATGVRLSFAPAETADTRFGPDALIIPFVVPE